MRCRVPPVVGITAWSPTAGASPPTLRSDGDDDFACRVAVLDQRHRVGRLWQGVARIDDRAQVTCFDEVSDLVEGLGGLRSDEGLQGLCDEHVERCGGRDVDQWPEPAVAVAVGLDQRPAWGEHPAQRAG